jgi:hypothetical protein
MNARTCGWMTTLTAAVSIGLLAGVCSDAQAGIEVQGKVYLKNNPTPTEGKIRAMPGFNKYVVTRRVGASEVTTEIEAARVDRVEVAQPKELAAAIRQAQTQPGAAIPVLKKIADDYVWLGWDMVAARYLLDAYLKSNQAGEAVKTGNNILSSNRDALQSADFLTAYVDAMVADNKEAGVERILSDAIQKGSRDVAAVAYVKRGNVLKKKGNVKEALVEGFLRATEMFQEQKDAQPEALYQAARCFEELAMGTQAEKMRRRLLKDFAGTPWADKVTTGK